MNHENATCKPLEKRDDSEPRSVDDSTVMVAMIAIETFSLVS